MKNITLSAEDSLIEQARQAAKAQHKTLNQAFREWLEQYARPESDRAAEYEALMKRLSYVKAGRKFTRQEMNER
jgi:hypothetical protein